MKTILPPDWPKTPADAIALQNTLRHQVVTRDDFAPPKTIAGIDVGYDTAKNLGRASIVVLDVKTLQPLHRVLAYLPETFPYVPGLLSFREIPVILEALKRLPDTPDFLMVDGQGIAHPRRLGIAAHLGVVTGLPAIGVAKSLLTGKYEEPGMMKGAREPLMDKGEQIGTVLRSKDKVKPLFISPGHRVGHDTAVEMVMRYLTKYRLPEPTRLADKYSKTLHAEAAETGLLL